MSEPAIFRVERLELSFAPRPWAFAHERRAEIDAYFTALRRERPALWNGRVLVLHHYAVHDGVLRGDFLETDYASFAAWNAWGCPPAGAYDCFGAAAIASTDGAVLLGVMAPHTFNAGRIYFPSGTPDPSDLVAGRVDLDRSVWRELAEETGLGPGDVNAGPDWTAVADGSLIALIKLIRSAQAAEPLRARMLAHLAGEAQPELSDIRIVRGPTDFEEAMPRFVTAFLTRFFGG
jgi:8-oxo-dGTP pyrophosphatase MutT (NUDIX family)